MESRVSDWMTSDPVAMREGDAALEALDKMVADRIRHVPIVDDTRRVIGILSLDDLRAAFPVDVSLKSELGPVERRHLLEYSVSDAMTWMPRTTKANATLEEAASELSEYRIGCLPVVDVDEALIGILSEIDVMRGLMATSKEERELASEAVETTRLVDELREERRRLIDQLAHWETLARDFATDAHGEPRDSADRIHDEHEVARLEALTTRAARRLRAIDAAIERGDFGVCESCGSAITTSRLRAVPGTTLCSVCARAEWEKPRFSWR